MLLLGRRDIPPHELLPFLAVKDLELGIEDISTCYVVPCVEINQHFEGNACYEICPATTYSPITTTSLYAPLYDRPRRVEANLQLGVRARGSLVFKHIVVATLEVRAFDQLKRKRPHHKALPGLSGRV